MFNLVIFGGPGSGKGTQSEKLIDRYGLTYQQAKSCVARSPQAPNSAK